MAHDLPNFIGVAQGGDLQRRLIDMSQMEGMPPPSTLPMLTGKGPFGPMEMGGMFTVAIRAGYRHPTGTAMRILDG